MSPAELRAIGCGPTSSAAVCVPSTIRCSRSHVVNGSRRSAGSGASATSRTTRPKLPACRTSVNARIACSSARWLRSPHSPGLVTTWPRTQSRRVRSTSAAAADSTSSASSASTTATSSPRRVAAAASCSSRLVRPDDRAPTTSDSWPRGNPPPRCASNPACADGATAVSSRGSTPGSAVVSVRSRRRVRRSDSRSARARGMVFRFIFAFGGVYGSPGVRSSDVRYALCAAGLNSCPSFG